MWTKRIKNIVGFGAVILICLLTIGFVSKKQSQRIIARVVVDIENRSGHLFVQEQDIIDLINRETTPYILGAEVQQISLRKLENTVKSHKFVEAAEVHRSLEGTLVVEVKQCQPIARILRRNTLDQYITETGKIIPVSDRYTARVPIVEGDFFEQFTGEDVFTNDISHSIFELINYVQADKFWRAQAAHFKVAKNGEIIMYPQVGKQYVEFGSADNMEDKFKRLRIFYEKILPHKGWNSYERVNVKYKGQIVCE